VILSAAAVVLGNVWIELRARGRVHSHVEAVPPADVALVLGTSAQLRSGHANPFFTGRMPSRPHAASSQAFCVRRVARRGKELAWLARLPPRRLSSLWRQRNR
jgi:vancomycin permeability regulator SanA